MNKKLKITIVGAGNIGLAMTACLTLCEKYHIVLYSHKTDLHDAPLILDDREQHSMQTIPSVSVTGNPKEAFTDADIVFCTYPAFLRNTFIEECGVYFPAGMMLGFVPGYGGAEFFCQSLLARGITVFGLQRVPYIARAFRSSESTTVCILSRKESLYAAAIPHGETAKAAKITEELLNIPCVPMREYLAVTLSMSNPLLHISGLYGVLHNYVAGERFAQPLKFYEAWNDETSRLLFQYDAELQEICRRLEPMDLSEVVSLPEYYESPTPEAMTKKLKSIEAFQAVMVPLEETSEGFVPDFTSRMFVEDFPYGVCIIKDFGRIIGTETPVVDRLLQFYASLTGHQYFHADGSYTEEACHTGMPGVFGIHTLEDVICFYSGC